MHLINVAIIRQGLSAVYDWIARFREAGTASCSNGSVGVSIDYGQHRNLTFIAMNNPLR